MNLTTFIIFLSQRNGLIQALKFQLVLILVALITVPITVIVSESLGITFETKEIYEQHISGYFLAVVFAPILEEVAFRYALNKSRYRSIISILALLIFLFTSDSILSKSVISIVILIVLARGVFVTRYGAYFEKRQKKIILIVAVCFALMHLESYEYKAYHYLLLVSPLLVSSQFLLGYFCGILAIEKFKYAVFLHAMHNFIVLSIYYCVEMLG